VLSQTKVSSPVLIVVSIARQKLSVFANDTEIGTSPVSTGVPGHPTPLGVFSVIQKQLYHESNLYSAAPMPYMQRITWSGIALHAGVLPGHPASHGCIRLPRDFAVELYRLTKVGARVVVTRGDPSPREIVHQALFQPKPPEQKEPDTAIGAGASAATTAVTTNAANADEITGSAPSEGKTTTTSQQAAPPAPRKGTVSVFISRKERKLYVRLNFEQLFATTASIADPDKPIGTHVFTALAPADNAAGMRWNVLSIPSSNHKKLAELRHGRQAESDSGPAQTEAASAAEALDRIDIPADARARVAGLLAPGASLIISDNGLSDETDNDTDFVVLTP
jgi:L,D-transpeptidase-like protein